MAGDEEEARGTGSIAYRRALTRIGIVFLGVLLFLTFFSRTILTFSLPHVTVTGPTSGALLRQIRGEGTIAAGRRTDLYVDGRRRVVEVRVKEGDNVSAGKVLMVLDAGDIQEQLAQAIRVSTSGDLDSALAGVAEARLGTLKSAADLAQMKVENLRVRVQNMRALLSRGAESGESVSRAELELSQATQDLREREDALQQRRFSLLSELRAALVVSPVDGLVTDLGPEEGGWADTSHPVVTLQPVAAALELRVTVPLSSARILTVGETQEVLVRDGSGRRSEAAITRIAETSSTGGGYREVTFAIPRDSDLRAGDVGEISIQKLTRAYSLLVPNAAVGTDAEGAFVWVLKERRTVLGTESYVVKAAVTTEDSDDFMTALSSGLEPGEKVMVRSTKPLAGSGARVVVD